jgi:hypothetical protein
MRIRTDYWARLTDHGHDWSAVDADHYAGTGTSPIGCGASKAAAIADLMRQLAETAWNVSS